VTARLYGSLQTMFDEPNGFALKQKNQHHVPAAVQHQSRPGLLAAHRPRLLIVSNDASRVTIEQACHASRFGQRALQVPLVVCRLLRDLLALRCDCDVRIDEDLLKINETDYYDNSEDGSFDGPAGLLVIHSEPPPADLDGFQDWISDWSLVRSAVKVWMGLERTCSDNTDEVLLAVYHVYFTTFNHPTDGYR
jgi:hypothetical protein